MSSDRESGVELRQHPRATLQADVTVVSASHFFMGRASDMSLGGIFVATYAALPVGSVVEVEVSLPDGDIKVVGVVRWVRDRAGVSPGLGIAFELLFDEERERIEQFCRVRAPARYEIDPVDPSANDR